MGTIIDRVTWERVRAVLADPSRKKQRSGGPYLLSGLVRSPAGDHVNGRVATGRNRHYAAKAGAAQHVQIDADRLEAAVTRAVVIRFDKAKLPAIDTTPGGNLDAIEAEMAELADLRGKGTITLAEWLAAREPLQRRLDEARAAVAPTPALPTLGESLRAVWPTLTVHQRQTVIRSVIREIVVRPVGRSRSVPIAERVTVVWKK